MGTGSVAQTGAAQEKRCRHGACPLFPQWWSVEKGDRHRRRRPFFAQRVNRGDGASPHFRLPFLRSRVIGPREIESVNLGRIASASGAAQDGCDLHGEVPPYSGDLAQNILPLATASASQGCGGTTQPLDLVIAKTTMGHAIIDEVARERLGGREDVTRPDDTRRVRPSPPGTPRIRETITFDFVAFRSAKAATFGAKGDTC